MNGKLLLILFSFLLNVKFSNQTACFIGDYNVSKLNEEICLSFSYQFTNEICYFTDGTEKSCENINQTEFEGKSDNKYSLSKIANNCGYTGFFEPLSATSCKDVNLVEGRCCYVNYTIEGDPTIHKSCLRTNKYKKDKIPEDIKDLFTKHYANASLIGAECKESNIKMKYNLIILFLIFLI